MCAVNGRYSEGRMSTILPCWRGIVRRIEGESRSVARCSTFTVATMLLIVRGAGKSRSQGAAQSRRGRVKLSSHKSGGGVVSSYDEVGATSLRNKVILKGIPHQVQMWCRRRMRSSGRHDHASSSSSRVIA